jgi:hypothetical protein
MSRLIAALVGRVRQLAPLIGLVLIVGLLSMWMPISHTLWREVLTISGTVETGSWLPTPGGENCTYTVGYWRNHPEDWPVAELTIGDATYTQDQAIAILETPPRGDATYILAHQLIAAKLNVLHGADQSAVASTIAEADDWLVLRPLGSDPQKPDREQGIVLAQVLDDYNQGVTGPGHCDGPPPTPPAPVALAVMSV